MELEASREERSSKLGDYITLRRLGFVVKSAASVDCQNEKVAKETGPGGLFNVPNRFGVEITVLTSECCDCYIRASLAQAWA